MFKELAALAQHSPLLLLVSREGEKLRVNLTRKADDKEKTTALSLSILATADELDAELPLALAEGLAMSDAPAATPTISEQVKGQVAAASSDEEDASPARSKSPTPKAKRARRASVKKATPKAAPKPVAAQKRRARRKVAAPEVTPVITPLIKHEASAIAVASGYEPKRRRRKGAATDTPEGGTSAGSGEPTAKSAPAPESSTGAGATELPQVGESLPPGETRTPVAPGVPITGDGSGTPLKPIRDAAPASACVETKPPAGETKAAPGETQPPASETEGANSGTPAAPATARDSKTLDLFS